VSIENNANETTRITIIIGILAIFITLLIYLGGSISKEFTVDNIILLIVYLHFFSICYNFLFYLLHKADSLTYTKESKGTLSEDMQILSNYCAIKLLGKRIPKDKNERYKLLTAFKRDYTHYYDDGVRLSMLFPYMLGLIIFINLTINWFISTFSALSPYWSYLIAFISYGIIVLLIMYILNVLRFKLTGTQ
jgi:hypothetical protein